MRYIRVTMMQHDYSFIITTGFLGGQDTHRSCVGNAAPAHGIFKCAPRHLQACLHSPKRTFHSSGSSLSSLEEEPASRREL